MNFEVVIVGGGPAGIAVAIECARRGIDTAVFERRGAPLDKACGEGLMPSGVVALERLGVIAHLGRDDCAPFDRIAWIQEDGRGVEAALPSPGGLGVRRTSLVRAMRDVARRAGVALFDACASRGCRIDRSGATLDTDAGEVRAHLVVAADGLHSPLRRAAGLEREDHGPRRYGLRRHATVAPWSRSVEVHFADGVEAYVTPSGAERVGVAFLWEHGRVDAVTFDALLARFPSLLARLADARWESTARGAGPLRQSVHSRVSERLVLIGDAAGYVDAITGEGLSLAFDSAAALGEILPDALSHGATAASLAPYEIASEKAFRRYAALASLVLSATRRPRLRRALFEGLIAWPRSFEYAVSIAMGAHSKRRVEPLGLRSRPKGSPATDSE